MGAAGMGTNALVYFMVPLRAYELGIGLGTIGLMLGTKAITEAVVSVPAGAVIDRIGPRWSCVIGAAAVAAVGVIFVLTSAVPVMFGALVVLGALRPLVWIGGQSYAAGMRGPIERGYDTARFSFAANAGQMVGPLVAGLVIGAADARIGFVVMIVHGALFTVIALLIPDVARHEKTSDDSPADRSGGFLPALKLLRVRAIQVDLLLTFTRLWIPSTWSAYLPIALVSAGTSVVIAGSVSTAMSFVSLCVALQAGRVSRWLHPALTTGIVLGASAVGVIITPLLASPPWVYLSAVLIGIGSGLSLPLLILLVTTSAPPDQRSLALGLRSSINQLASAVSPVLTGNVIAVTSIAVGLGVSGVLALGLASTAIVLHLVRSRGDGTRAQGTVAPAPPPPEQR